MQMVLLENQAAHGTKLDETHENVVKVLDNQETQQTTQDRTLKKVLLIETMLETVKHNLDAIRQTTADSSTHQLLAAAVTKPLQQEEEPPEGELKRAYKVLHCIQQRQCIVHCSPKCRPNPGSCEIDRGRRGVHCWQLLQCAMLPHIHALMFGHSSRRCCMRDDWRAVCVAASGEDAFGQDGHTAGSHVYGPHGRSGEPAWPQSSRYICMRQQHSLELLCRLIWTP